MSEVAGEFEPDETNKFLLKENTPENRAKRAKRIGQLCGAALEGISTLTFTLTAGLREDLQP